MCIFEKVKGDEFKADQGAPALEGNERTRGIVSNKVSSQLDDTTANERTPLLRGGLASRSGKK